MKDVTGKTVFITGGAGGIAMGMAKAFAREGAKLVLADVDQARLGKAEGQLRDMGATVMTAILDVTNYDDWQRTIDDAERKMGPVSILCNNAGIAASCDVADDVPSRWKLALDVNILGQFYGCRTVLPRMLARKDESHIVNTASLAGLKAEKGMSSYSASKYAVVGLSDSLRQELEGTSAGISVLYPGMTNTGIVTNSWSMVESRTATKITPADSSVKMLLQHGMNPDKIGERVVRAVRDGEYHIITHPEHRPRIEAFFQDRLNSFTESADPEYHEDIENLLKTIKGE